ncbi:transcriptional regulator [Streptomyces sp. CB02923]|uniref:ScbA/BarX family gamma-butyrolactone biosynthesis protein n=1 Tax=Streptomyces sp. CB02923 TaxID=1718985 RepID=UPI000938F5D6|nr:ScbA/BarX family gamma-butyrolactone biosynthesis protein [Streptomyces sp. CB02923]OKI01228.1 transcriptional regulator [Streptomyces sp. CB02923]
MASATLTAPSTTAGHRPFAGREHTSLSDLPPLTTTVPRQYVHRTAVSEVFLTDWRRAGTDAWVVSAQWPRAHSFYSPVDGLHDPMLLVETMRQASILLSHVAHGVPLDHPIIWQDLHYSLVPEALRVTGTPAEIELHITDHDLLYRGDRLASARQLYRVLCDGTELASAELHFSCHSPAVYRRLRGEYSDLQRANARKLDLAEPVTPRLVARDRTGDVVLSPTGHANRWQLRVNTAHPVLFDHPVDHAPGMLMMEAARQAAHAAAGPGFSLPADMTCSFRRYGELDAPCWVAVTPAGRDACDRLLLDITVRQNGRPVFTARAASQSIR